MSKYDTARNRMIAESKRLHAEAKALREEADQDHNHITRIDSYAKCNSILDQIEGILIAIKILEEELG